MKWRLFERDGHGYVGKLYNFVNKDIFITFINNCGKPDVTVGKVRSSRLDGSLYVASLWDENLNACREGIEIAWSPATLPEPFVEGESNPEWVSINESLPKIGEDVFLTYLSERGNVVVTHSRLNVSFIFRNECAFRGISSCAKHYGDYIDRGKVLAWMPAKLPKPYDITKIPLVFRTVRPSEI